MIIIRMTGGLGNQMFQYALFLKLQSMGREVKLEDFTEYQSEQDRPHFLWVFGIAYPKATREELNKITDGFVDPLSRIRRKLTGRKTLEYHEKEGCFDPEILQRTPAYLTGYFQSERYFEDIRSTVLNAFQFQPVIYEHITEELADKIKAYRAKIEATQAVSIHIRRGDYLELIDTYGGICTEAYYEEAIREIEEQVADARFFLFSNDPAWCREWLHQTFDEEKQLQFTIIEGTDESTGYLDMMLMSRCRHHILANSSFSWWGAYLGRREGSIQIAPSIWFHHLDMKDIYYPGLRRITPEGQRIYE